MYKLVFTTYTDTDTVLYFDDSSDAVNEGVRLQVKLGGYNSEDWEYYVEREDGKIVYDDIWSRHFG
jgi:hypothetical protein